MLKLGKVRFPLYKLRSYLDIDTNLLGITKVTTIKGIYILDDATLPGDFEHRRACIVGKVYKLKERVIYLRQLVKYKSGTTFVDADGKLFKYKKSSKMFDIRSAKIVRKVDRGNWTVIHLQDFEQPFIVGQAVLPSTKYASIMHSSWGPFLYDLTSKKHEPYKRKI